MVLRILSLTTGIGKLKTRRIFSPYFWGLRPHVATRPEVSAPYEQKVPDRKAIHLRGQMRVFAGVDELCSGEWMSVMMDALGVRADWDWELVCELSRFRFRFWRSECV